MTNATKANLIAVANALMGVLVAFHVPLSQAQQGAIIVLVNAIFVGWIGLTYHASRKRTA